MPTDEFTPLLDREHSLENAKEITAIASPLLRELVNHAAWAFHRCSNASIRPGGENEDLAPFVLYRHLIELVDGVEVLMASSCANASVPLVRAAFEAWLSLRYILAADYRQRSLSWSHGHIRARIHLHRRLDRTTPVGAAAAEVFDRNRYPTATPPDVTLYDSAPAIERLERLLTRPEFAPIEIEFLRLKAKYKRKPPDWFELFDGPANRRELAKSIGEEAQYLGFYGEWSSFSHAADASEYLTEGRNPGETGFIALRSPAKMPDRSWIVAFYLLNATRVMTEHFRGGENLMDWYVNDVRPRMESLRTLKIEFRE